MLVPGGAETIGVAVIVLIFFLLHAAREMSNSASSDQFYFAARKASYRQLSRGWAATTISFAVGLFYYMQMTYIYGAWVFLISLGTYLLGNLAFIFVTRNYQFPEFSSIGNVVRDRTNSAVLGTAINIAGCISLFALLFLELFYGARIASSILVDQSQTANTLLFLGLVAIVGTYVSLGGMSAVLASDRWQLALIYAGVVGLIILGAAATGNSMQNGTWNLQLAPAIPFATGNVAELDIVSLIAFGLAVNSLTLFLQTSSWQLAASTGGDSRVRAVIRGIVSAFSIFAICVLVAILYRSAGMKIDNPGDIFVPAGLLGDAGTHFLVPLIFAGFLSALVSTADTTLLAASLTLSRIFRPVADDNDDEETAGEDDTDIAAEARRDFILRYVCLVIMLAALVGFYFIVNYYLSDRITQFFLATIFYLFSHGVVFAPVIIASVMFPHRLRPPRVLIVGLLGCWGLETLAAYLSITTGELKVQFYGTVVVVALAWLTTVRIPWPTLQRKARA